MIIQTKTEFKDYLKITYFLYYRKPWAIFSVAVSILILASGIYGFWNAEVVTDPITNLVIGLFILLFVPITLYFGAKRSFKTSKSLNSPITFEFRDHFMKVETPDAKSEINLNAVYKIEEFKNLILIYHNKSLANYISKKDISEKELQDLKYIFLTLKDVKVILHNYK